MGVRYRGFWRKSGFNRRAQRALRDNGPPPLSPSFTKLTRLPQTDFPIPSVFLPRRKQPSRRPSLNQPTPPPPPPPPLPEMLLLLRRERDQSPRMFQRFRT
ncbi:unnamed protein product [Closterium sp. NIES-53]